MKKQLYALVALCLINSSAHSMEKTHSSTASKNDPLNSFYTLYEKPIKFGITAISLIATYECGSELIRGLRKNNI